MVSTRFAAKFIDVLLLSIKDGRACLLHIIVIFFITTTYLYSRLIRHRPTYPTHIYYNAIPQLSGHWSNATNLSFEEVILPRIDSNTTDNYGCLHDIIWPTSEFGSTIAVEDSSIVSTSEPVMIIDRATYGWLCEKNCKLRSNNAVMLTKAKFPTITIAIPTVKRKSAAGVVIDYLSATLQHLNLELSRSHSGMNYVLNNLRKDSAYISTHSYKYKFNSIESSETFWSPISDSDPYPLKRFSVEEINEIESIVKNINILVYNPIHQQNYSAIEASDPAPFEMNMFKYASKENFQFIQERMDYSRSPCGPAIGNRVNGQTKPGPQARQHTCDIIHMFKYVREYMSSTGVVFLLEDDFLPCRGSLIAFAWAVVKASRATFGWRTLRVSTGMNGIAIQKGDLASLCAYLYKNIHNFPVDVSTANWYADRFATKHKTNSEFKLNRVYRYNLFKHTGAISSYAGSRFHDGRYGLHCYDTIGSYMSVFDTFDVSMCYWDDLWPCTRNSIMNAPSTEVLTHWSRTSNQNPHTHLPLSPSHLTAVASPIGGSCAHACGYNRCMRSQYQGFAQINSCSVLRALSNGCPRGCWKGFEAFAPYISSHGRCVVQGGHWLGKALLHINTHARSNEDAINKYCSVLSRDKYRVCPCKADGR